MADRATPEPSARPPSPANPTAAQAMAADLLRRASHPHGGGAERAAPLRQTRPIDQELGVIEAALRDALRKAGMLEARALRHGKTDSGLDRRYLAAVGEVDALAVRHQALLEARRTICADAVLERRRAVRDEAKELPGYRERVQRLRVPEYVNASVVRVPRARPVRQPHDGEG